MKNISQSKETTICEPRFQNKWLFNFIMFFLIFCQFGETSIPLIVVTSSTLTVDEKNRLSNRIALHPCIKIVDNQKQFKNKLEEADITKGSCTHHCIILDGLKSLQLFISAMRNSSITSKHLNTFFRKYAKTVWIQRSIYFSGINSLGFVSSVSSFQNGPSPIDMVGNEMLKTFHLVNLMEDNVKNTLRSLFDQTSFLKDRTIGFQGKKHEKSMHRFLSSHSAFTIKTPLHKSKFSSSESPQIDRREKKAVHEKKKIIRVAFCSLLCSKHLPDRFVEFIGTPPSSSSLIVPHESSHGELLSICGGSNSQQTIIESKVNIDASKLHEWASHRNLPWAPLVLTTNECSKSSVTVVVPLGVESPSSSLSSTTSVSPPVVSTSIASNNSNQKENTRGLVPDDPNRIVFKHAPCFGEEVEHVPLNLLSLVHLVKVYRPYFDGRDAQVVMLRKLIEKKVVKSKLYELEIIIFNILKNVTPTHGADDKLYPPTHRYSLSVSSFLPNLQESEQFCENIMQKSVSSVGNPPPSTHNYATNTAVCFVGSTRTLLRQDVQDSLLYRFYAGWGIQHMWTFAVLSDTTHNRPPIEEFLDHLNAVILEWYEPPPSPPCGESEQGAELNQWTTCMGYIKKYETRHDVEFDAVVKLQADEFWYGAMLPHCVLNIRNTVYISRHRSRWSDQWFSLPRKLATQVTKHLNNELREKCSQKHNESILVRADQLVQFSPINFAEYFLNKVTIGTNINKYDMVTTHLPRIRTCNPTNQIEALVKKEPVEKKRSEADFICEQFFWLGESTACIRMVLGNDHGQKYVYNGAPIPLYQPLEVYPFAGPAERQ